MRYMIGGIAGFLGYLSGDLAFKFPGQLGPQVSAFGVAALTGALVTMIDRILRQGSHDKAPEPPAPEGPPPSSPTAPASPV